jgi:DNA-binding MltR family transcriptional regulator
MNKKRSIDDALIRSAADRAAIALLAINYHAMDLQHELNVLHEEMEYADPCNDKPFEKFMYYLARYINELNPSYEFDELIKAMQKFQRPQEALNSA